MAIITWPIIFSQTGLLETVDLRKEQRMKNKMRLLVLLAVFTVTVWYVQQDNTLSDQDLETIVGGLDCHYCGDNGDGCADYQSVGECLRPDCDGYYITSCKQAQKHCISDNTTATCTNDNASCTGQYMILDCVKSIGYDPRGEPFETCTYDDGGTFDCGGEKTDC